MIEKEKNPEMNEHPSECSNNNLDKDDQYKLVFVNQKMKESDRARNLIYLFALGIESKK